MKRRWGRWLAPILCIVVLTLGACSPPESGGGDGAAPDQAAPSTDGGEPSAAPVDNPGPGDYDY